MKKKIKDNQKGKEIIYRLGELFCGPGGIALGAMRAKVIRDGTTHKIEHAWANDYDADTCSTYSKNICRGKTDSVICSDVRKIDIDKLSPIDCFAYGFPCNDFSVVGEKKGFNGQFGPLYTYGVNVLNKFKPKFFIAENVKGLSSSNDGHAFRKILSDLESAGNGYNLTTHLYKFEEYGVPQTRHRIIIVGIDKRFGKKFKVPAPNTQKPISAREALELPPIPETAANQEYTTQSKTVIDRLKYIKPGENAWNAKLPKQFQLNVRGARLSQIYKRLTPDDPAYTITGSGGGGTHVYHWEEPRALTNRERARIQTFPDDFSFEGKKESVRKQIGMAVPPIISEMIFKHVLMTILDMDYKFADSSEDNQIRMF